LFGTSFTKLPRLDGAGDAVSGGAITAPARARIHALALASPAGNERVGFVRNYLQERGLSGAAAEEWLARNLMRYAGEQSANEERMRQAAGSSDEGAKLFVASTLYEKRGLSMDTSLLVNYAIESTLAALKSKRVLAPGSIRRIGVIGPGLDFADKREGSDSYPLQTIQPFAVMDAAVAHGLAAANDVQVTGFDLNPAVLSHLRRLGSAYYRIQLPRDPRADWSTEAIAYWDRALLSIGAPEAAAPAGGIVIRKVRITREAAGRVVSADLNVVTQTRATGAFELIAATNILVYYDRFHQALALASIAHMLSTDGVFLSNTALPAQKPPTLEYLGRRSISYSASGGFGDDVFVYRKR